MILQLQKKKKLSAQPFAKEKLFIQFKMEFLTMIGVQKNNNNNNEKV